MSSFELRVAPSAERALSLLPAAAAAAVVEFITVALVDAPRRVGKPLQRELSGLMVARRGPYRVVYEISDDEHAILVPRINHRADIYRR